MRYVFYDFSEHVRSIYAYNVPDSKHISFILTTRENVEKIAEVHFHESGMSIQEEDTNFWEHEKIYIAMLSKLFYEQS